MAAAAAMVEGERDPVAVRAAHILFSLRSRKLRERPEWVPMPAGEASSPGTAPAEVPERWGRRRPRSGGRRGSWIPWWKALREMDLAAAAAAGSGGKGRDAALAGRPVEAALYYGAAAGSGSPSRSSADRAARTQPRPFNADEKAAAKALAAAPAKEPMKASSPDTPLDYDAGGSRASSSADDAARPQVKRKGPGARGSGGGASSGDDDEGCSSPAKRARVAADEEKPIPTELSMQSETRASNGKGLPFDFDLNLPPSDEDGCPGAC